MTIRKYGRIKTNDDKEVWANWPKAKELKFEGPAFAFNGLVYSFDKLSDDEAREVIKSFTPDPKPAFEKKKDPSLKITKSIKEIDTEIAEQLGYTYDQFMDLPFDERMDLIKKHTDKSLLEQRRSEQDRVTTNGHDKAKKKTTSKASDLVDKQYKIKVLNLDQKEFGEGEKPGDYSIRAFDDSGKVLNSFEMIKGVVKWKIVLHKKSDFLILHFNHLAVKMKDQFYLPKRNLQSKKCLSVKHNAWQKNIKRN
jgi:hypothetical protein